MENDAYYRPSFLSTFLNCHRISEKVSKKSTILNLFFIEAYNSKMENNADYRQSTFIFKHIFLQDLQQKFER
jgi:hypothetical protein